MNNMSKFIVRTINRAAHSLGFDNAKLRERGTIALYVVYSYITDF